MEDVIYPIIVDGPAKGRRIEVSRKAYTFQAVCSMPVTDPLSIPDSYTAAMDSSLSVFTYHLHRFYLLGRMLSIASIHAIPPDSQQADDFLWSQVVTDRAKEAVRENVPRRA